MALPNRDLRFTLKRTLFTLTASLALIAPPLAVSAQTTPPYNSQSIQYDSLKETAQRGGFPLGVPSIPKLAATIINAALQFIGALLLLIVLYAGFTWMTAAGNEEKIIKAKKMLVSASIGLIIILSGYAISSFLIKTVQQATTSGSGNVPVMCSNPNVCIPRANCINGRTIITGASCSDSTQVCCSPAA